MNVQAERCGQHAPEQGRSELSADAESVTRQDITSVPRTMSYDMSLVKSPRVMLLATILAGTVSLIGCGERPSAPAEVDDGLLPVQV
jgi:hypothetical protein